MIVPHQLKRIIEQVVRGMELTAANMENRTRHVFIPAKQFDIASGTPTFGVVGTWATNYQAWQFDDSANEHVTTWWKIPEDWATGSIRGIVHWTSASGTSGVCRWSTGLISISGSEGADGDAATSSYAVQTKDADAPGTAGLVRKDSTGSFSSTIHAGDIVRVQVGRRGGEAGDTMTGDAYFLGIEYEYTADS